MAEIHLYGKLRKYYPGKPSNYQYTVNLIPIKGERLSMIIERAGIPIDDVYHVFLNRKLLATKCTMAEALGYRQVRENPMNWDLDIKANDTDRIGLFGSDMSALVI
ncbi:hypothetical protein ACFL20_01335 [Spirochaetota bacterium]